MTTLLQLRSRSVGKSQTRGMQHIAVTRRLTSFGPSLRNSSNCRHQHNTTPKNDSMMPFKMKPHTNIVQKNLDNETLSTRLFTTHRQSICDATRSRGLKCAGTAPAAPVPFSSAGPFIRTFFSHLNNRNPIHCASTLLGSSQPTNTTKFTHITPRRISTLKALSKAQASRFFSLPQVVYSQHSISSTANNGPNAHAKKPLLRFVPLSSSVLPPLFPASVTPSVFPGKTRSLAFVPSPFPSHLSSSSFSYFSTMPKTQIKTTSQRRPLKAAITLTRNAANRLQFLLSRQKDPKEAVGIRIGVKKRGCNGLSYTMDYAHEAAPRDEVVTDPDTGIKVFIEPGALFSIIGTEMDFVEDNISAEFVFLNPNAKSLCGCGESFTV